MTVGGCTFKSTLFSKEAVHRTKDLCKSTEGPVVITVELKEKSKIIREEVADSEFTM